VISTLRVALLVGLFAHRCAFAEGPASDLPSSVFQIKPGERFTFLSDRVVEAQSTSCELFGLDRAAAISTQSAEQIAAAAKRFGQDDDITALTLTFAPIEVAHA
jgi:serine phosphatase RsbU (regulator of sigma subunit)